MRMPIYRIKNGAGLCKSIFSTNIVFLRKADVTIYLDVINEVLL